MKIRVSTRFKRSYKQLPLHIQRSFDEKVFIFVANPRDPQLRTHKLKGKLQDCLAFRLKNGFRVLFEFVDSSTVNLLDVGSHDQYFRWKK